jgi:N-acetylglucosamine-6-phosphate deacetylase
MVDDAAVVISDNGRIAYAGPAHGAPRTRGQWLDLGGRTILPGLIDVHVHGGSGVTFGVPGRVAEDLRSYSQWVTSFGVTGFLSSVAASDPQALLLVVRESIAALQEGLPGAEGLGLHLEGPFLNPEKKGAFNLDWLRAPSLDEVDALLEAGKGWIRQVTLAPELPGARAVAARLRVAGVVAALGHSNADYALASEALRSDFTHVTHTFNAQRGLQQREPGVWGAVLASDRVTAELIADTVHVHPGTMKVLLRCLGAQRVVLVTDAMAAAGLSDGEYNLVGEAVTVRNGRATLADGTIAGSTATLNECVRHMHRDVGAPLAQAVRMATLNPARAMGLPRRLGSLMARGDGNLAVVDADVHVCLTLVRGRVVYSEL